MKLRLHNYWRSSASHRVRIGLGLTGLAYEYVAVNILQKQQHADAYKAHNAMGQVPTLEILEDDGTTTWLAQSLPILEYVDERFGQLLLPQGTVLRAKARAIAEMVNSGIQPLQNLSTTKRLVQMGVDDKVWVKAFIAEGMSAVAAAVSETSGQYCVGDAPTIADCCLIPQLASARRFGLLDGDTWTDHAPLPDHRAALDNLIAIEKRCMALPAFVDAAPDRQPDAVKS